MTESSAQAVRGFYAVLDRDEGDLARLLVGPTPAGAGARVLQLRIKPDEPLATRALLDAARRARAIATEAGALLIINDRLDLAIAADADGVHLGQDDLPLADARRLADLAGAHRGRPLLVGISTHDVTQVRAAVAGGADYLGFGPVFATSTKRNPDPVQGIAGLRAAVQAARSVPIVAIGGITAEMVGDVAAAGAAAACAIGAVNGAADVAAAGRAIGRPWLPT